MSRKGLGLILSLLVLLLSACGVAESPTRVEGELQVTFIDVGQGDAALLLGSGGKSLLIDTGPGQAYGAVERALKKAGFSQPEGILISHGDADHLGAGPGILKNMGTQAFYMNLEDRDTRLYAATLREVLNLGLTPLPLLPGQVLDWEEGVLVEVLGPLKTGLTNPNNQSAVVKVTFGDHSFLFTGDIEEAAERDLVERYGRKLRSTVVKVPHHGSDSSSTPEFVRAVGANIGVLSYGKDNAYGHPHADVVVRWQEVGTELYATPRQGTMTFTSDGRRLWLSAEKSLEPMPVMASSEVVDKRAA